MNLEARNLRERVLPREYNEQERFLRLVAVSPQPGDILIKKVWTNKKPDGTIDTDAKKIRRGQMLAVRKRGGSHNSEHAAICSQVDYICESDGRGVSQAKIDLRTNYLLFRCTSTPLSYEAAWIARRLSGDKTVSNKFYNRHLGRNVDAPEIAHINYSWEKAGGQWRDGWDNKIKPYRPSALKSKRYGKSGKRLVENLYDMVYGASGKDFADRLNKDKEQAMETLSLDEGLFCSEFVAACYMIAAKRRGVTCFKVDPSAMTPKGFESLLETWCANLFSRYRVSPAGSTDRADATLPATMPSPQAPTVTIGRAVRNSQSPWPDGFDD